MTVTEQTLRVVKLQRFSTHDGPGIRTVVFCKGCPLRCAWCHNPETQQHKKQLFYRENACIGCRACEAVCNAGAHRFEPDGRHIFDVSVCKNCMQCAQVCPSAAIEPIGTDLTVTEILSAVERDRAFYGKEGGLTVSGGEPMAQPEACLSLLRQAKAANLHTAVETCGQFEKRYVKPLCESTDLLLWDCKDTDPARHLAYTGVSTEKILSNLLLADQYAKQILLRCILVSGVNTEPSHYRAIAQLAGRLRHCIGVEFLAYHAYGGSKASQLGNADNGRVDWIPTEEQIEQAKRMVRDCGCTVWEA